MRCPECDAVNPPEAVRCKACGEKLRRQARPAKDPEREERPDEGVRVKPRRQPKQDEPAPPRKPAARAGDEDRARPRKRRREDEDDEESLAATIVPYKNPVALISYYLGYVSLIVGLVAIVSTVVVFQRAEGREGASAETIDRIRLILRLGLGLGAVLGAAGTGLGIFGFLYGRTYRRAKGQAHATTGIVLGVLNMIAQPVALILILRYINSLLHR